MATATFKGYVKRTDLAGPYKGRVVTTNVVQSPVQGSADYKEEHDTPYYGNVVARGDPLPANKYVRFKNSNLPPILNIVGSSSNNTYKWDWNYHHYYLHTFITEASLDAMFGSDVRFYAMQQARAKFVDNVRGTLFDSMTFIGELKETYSMLFNTLKRAVKLYYSLRNGRFGHDVRRLIREYQATDKFKFGRHRRSLFDDMSNLWLEAYYGWQPLIHSVLDFRDALDSLNLESKYDSFKGTQKKTDSQVLYYSHYGPKNGEFNKLHVLKTTSYTYRAGVGATFDREIQNHDFDSIFGLTKAQIPISFWELVRFSFIIDYFANVGGLLRNLNPPFQGIVSGTTYQFEYIEGEISYTYLFVTPSAGQSIKEERGEGITYNGFKFTRTPIEMGNMYVRPALNPEPWWLGVLNTVLIVLQQQSSWKHMTR